MSSIASGMKYSQISYFSPQSDEQLLFTLRDKEVTKKLTNFLIEGGRCFQFSGRSGSFLLVAAAAAKSLQSCPTLCDPRDGSLPGSPIPGILQARILEWVAISFSNA